MRFGVCLLFILQISVTNAQSTNTVGLLGVYHFNNPGLDEFNTEVDDYLAPERQTQLKEVTNHLQAYNPTKILVEASPARQSQLDSLYTLYREDKLALADLKGGRNETYQLGFRLAKKLGHERVYAVDAEGYWLADELNNKLSPAQKESMKSQNEEMGRVVQELQQFLDSHTVLENLRYLNEPEHIALNHSYYNPGFVSYNRSLKNTDLEYRLDSIAGEEQIFLRLNTEQLGAELVAEWYRRNIKIFSKVLHYSAAENERLLVIFGQGHIRILNHLFEDHPAYEVTPMLRFLE